MPNQRKKSKKGISVYVPGIVHDSLRAEAEKIGITLSEYVTRLYREELKRRGYKIEEENKDEQ